MFFFLENIFSVRKSPLFSQFSQNMIKNFVSIVTDRPLQIPMTSQEHRQALFGPKQKYNWGSAFSPSPPIPKRWSHSPYLKGLMGCDTIEINLVWFIYYNLQNVNIALKTNFHCQIQIELFYPFILHHLEQALKWSAIKVAPLLPYEPKKSWKKIVQLFR